MNNKTREAIFHTFLILGIMSFSLLLLAGCSLVPKSAYTSVGQPSTPAPIIQNNTCGGSCQVSPVVTPPFYAFSTIKIANWNLQIFGDSKASNKIIMDTYMSKIKQYDIFFIQEIRDADSSSFYTLCQSMPEYDCQISSRAGRSTSKEQYGVFYKKGIPLQSFIDFNPDPQDRWERPPILASFLIKNRTVSIYNLHAKPEDAEIELKNLYDLTKVSLGDIVSGDLNFDCSYADPNINVLHSFTDWNWVIKNNEDTTVGDNSCAYDRFFVKNDLPVLASGIDTNITSELSDHYIIWMEI